MMNRFKATRLLVFCALVSTLLIVPSSAQKWERYGPGTRSQASAVYDPTTNQMFVFGGQHAPTNVDFNDTWVVQNVIPSSPSTQQSLQCIRVPISGKGPGVRFGHSAVYNSTSNREVIFGGGTGFPKPCVNELWVVANLNSKGGSPTWNQYSLTGTLPPVREGHTAVYDPNTNKMIVFGGTDCNGNYYNDVWILNDADGSTATPSWTQVTPTGTAPGARSQATAIYDSVNNVMTVFGGGTKTSTFNDIWTLSNANGVTGTPTWTKRFAKGTAPAPRMGHSAVYDSANNRMIVYGGSNNRGKVLNDGWILSNANGVRSQPTWTQYQPTAAGPYRKSHTAIYDPVSNDMVIFGGDSEIPLFFTDDHVLILTDANGLGTKATGGK